MTRPRALQAGRQARGRAQERKGEARALGGYERGVLEAEKQGGKQRERRKNRYTKA
jgi:hypothetical protein